MKIAHLINSSDTGGAQSLVEGLAKHAQPDQEVHVGVLSSQGALATRLEAAATSVTHLGSRGQTSDIVSLAPAVRRWLADLTPDIVHSHLFQANLLAGLTVPGRARQVWTIHTSGHGRNDSVRTRLVVKALGLTVWRADALVACSGSANSWIRARWKRASVSTIVNGVPVLASNNDVVRSRSSYIVSLARAHDMKDHANLFRAFALSHGASGMVLRCAGDGVEPGNPLIASALASVPREVVERIELLGPIADPSELLFRAEGLVISSAYGEALPMAALEAVARAVPVVTTDVGDCAAASVRPELVARPRDPNGLGAAIDFLVRCDDHTRQELRRASLALAHSFSIESVVDQYAKLYRELCNVC